MTATLRRQMNGSGMHSSIQYHRDSQPGRTDVLVLLWLWSHFTALYQPTHLILECPCCQLGCAQLSNVAWCCSGLFSICLWRTSPVSFMQVSCILLWSQEEDSLVFLPQSSVGTEIKIERRQDIFPISEPRTDYCLLSKYEGLSKSCQKACRLRSNDWILGISLKMACWSCIIAEQLFSPLQRILINVETGEKMLCWEQKV